MRQIAALGLALLLALALCACSDSGPYTVTRNGRDYEIDKAAGTISDGRYTYQFALTGNASQYDLEITYPDGSTYWWTQEDSSMGHGGWSDGYGEGNYAQGDDLRDALLAKAPRARAGHPVLGLILLAAGLFCAAAPRAVWELQYGWRFKDAEPSDLALAMNRICGIAAAVIAVILMLL